MRGSEWVVCTAGRHWVHRVRRAHLVTTIDPRDWVYYHFVLEFGVVEYGRERRYDYCMVTWDGGRCAERCVRFVDRTRVHPAVVHRVDRAAAELLLGWRDAVEDESSLSELVASLTTGLVTLGFAIPSIRG